MRKDAAVFVTIDSPSTKDVDDAIKVSQIEGGFEVVVAIADPTDQVVPDSPLDLDAREKAATVYVRDSARISMLPRRISEGMCSLTANKPRSSFVFTIRLDQELRVVEFRPSVEMITVSQRLHYHQIPQIAGNNDHPLHAQIQISVRLAQAMLESRRKHGALALYDLYQFLMTDEEGNLVQLESRNDTVGHVVVQEMMILCNRLLAEYLAMGNIPAIYRNHQATNAAPPTGELMSTLQSLLSANNGDKAVAGARLNTILGRAKYEPVAKGHYGLNLPLYTHGTSPLRRYPDLVNLQQLKCHLQGKPFVYSQDQLWAITEKLNETLWERKVATAEFLKGSASRKAESMERAGKIEQMDDNMLNMAVRNARITKQMSGALSNEVARRFKAGSITDAVIVRLFFEVERRVIPDNLAQAMSDWLFAFPMKAVCLINHGIQVKFLAEHAVSTTNVQSMYASKAKAIIVATNTQVTGRAKGTRRKEAEQLANAILLAKIADLPYEDPKQAAEVAVKTAHKKPAGAVNSKGALLELCAKNQLKPPLFNIRTKGPDHQPTFVCVATAQVNGTEVEVRSDPAVTRKAAEAHAAQLLLVQLQRANIASRPKTHENPVSAVQEYMQKKGLPMPEYSFVCHSQTPPVFECTVSIQVFGSTATKNMKGSTKSEAKRLAATEVLQLLSA